MQGGCLCGRVRYTIAVDPLATIVCHCTHCQKQGGSAFSVNLVVPAAAFRQSGEDAVYLDTGDSGLPVHRHFCPACGSPILSRLEIMPGVLAVKAGTLDDPSSVKPGLRAYAAREQAWLKDFAHIASVPGAPPPA